MTSAGVSVKRWPKGQAVIQQAIEALMQDENLACYKWSNGPGDVYGAHQHDFHKVIYVLNGSITFGLPEASEKICLSAGDRLDLPPGVVHNAIVGDQGVVCLEGHRRR